MDVTLQLMMEQLNNFDANQEELKNNIRAGKAAFVYVLRL
jgi:hypothetical protein